MQESVYRWRRKRRQLLVTTYKIQIVTTYKIQIVTTYKIQIVTTYKIQIVTAYKIQIVTTYKIQIVSTYKIQIVTAYKIQIVTAYKIQIVTTYKIQIVTTYKIQIVTAYKIQIVTTYKIHIVTTYKIHINHGNCHSVGLFTSFLHPEIFLMNLRRLVPLQFTAHLWQDREKMHDHFMVLQIISVSNPKPVNPENHIRIKYISSSDDILYQLYSMFMIEGTAVAVHDTGTAVGRRLQKGAPAYPAYCCWKRLAM